MSKDKKPAGERVTTLCAYCGATNTWTAGWEYPYCNRICETGAALQTDLREAVRALTVALQTIGDDPLFDGEPYGHEVAQGASRRVWREKALDPILATHLQTLIDLYPYH
jgi:hypothetical protein